MRVTIRPSDWSVRMGPIGDPMQADRRGGASLAGRREGWADPGRVASRPKYRPPLSPLESVTCVPLTQISRPAGQLVLRPLFCSMYHSRRECSEEGRLSRDRPTG